MDKRIYHIVSPADWEPAQRSGEYRAASLAEEGFIHCSFAAQLDMVMKRYYSGAGSVTVLEIDPDRLTAELVEEPSTNDEIYPHIYGPLNVDAVVGVSIREAPED